VTIDPDAKDVVVKMDAAAKGQEALAMVKQYVKQAQETLWVWPLTRLFHLFQNLSATPLNMKTGKVGRVRRPDPARSEPWSMCVGSASRSSSSSTLGRPQMARNGRRRLDRNSG
jgi:hypothetical protein